MTEKNQSAGRKQNAAQPLGERAGLLDKTQTARTAAKERKSAGPDGPDARETAPPVK
ncbi:MAG: hypothetical protein JWO72_2106 [Caulobacteraceae bacterium]|nr:hypothetical protein [Caulobacteraceae bacterium]